MAEDVFKYMKIQYAIESLKNGIYAGKANDFNDPYEEKDIRYINDYRICCLASSYNKMLMWAHYGNHKQCCIKFSVEDNIVYPVKYVSDYNITRKHIEEASAEMFFYKAKEWDYEKEKRAVCDIKNYDVKVWKKVEDEYYLRANPKIIYLGLRVDLKKPETRNLLEYVEEHNLSNKDREIKVKLCDLRND